MHQPMALIQRAEVFSQHESPQETTLVHHVFGGYERMQNVCTVCGTVSACFDPFSMLSVEIDEDIATVEDALARCVLYTACL